MKKKISLVFTNEEAEVLVNVFTAYQLSYSELQLKVPGVDIDYGEMKYIDESIGLLYDALALGIDVVLECDPSIWWVLYSLATITSTYFTETNDHVCYSCIIKLLHGGKRGASSWNQ